MQRAGWRGPFEQPGSLCLLAESISAWPDQATCHQISRAGWSAVRWRNLTGDRALHAPTSARNQSAEWLSAVDQPRDPPAAGHACDPAGVFVGDQVAITRTRCPSAPSGSDRAGPGRNRGMFINNPVGGPPKTSAVMGLQHVRPRL